MTRILLALFVSTALYVVCGAYPFSPSDRLALRSYLRDALLGDAMEGPATRQESAANNKLIIPPNTFVSGGAGEGKQHLGSAGKIPNKQVAIPEVQPGYSTPPNPCPKTMDEKDKESVGSSVHQNLQCYCEAGWQESDQELDCTQSEHCCLATMSNTATFVHQYQKAGEANDKQQEYMPFKRNQYITGEERQPLVAKKSPEIIAKRSSTRRFASKRHNPFLDGQPLLDGLVAKKAPNLSGVNAM